MLALSVEKYFKNFQDQCFNTCDTWRGNFMSLLAEIEDLVLGPQHVDGTNLHELFLNLHINLQQVVIEHLFHGDDGWDYLLWMVCDGQLVIHWENFDFSSTHCAIIELLPASENQTGNLLPRLE